MVGLALLRGRVQVSSLRDTGVDAEESAVFMALSLEMESPLVLSVDPEACCVVGVVHESSACLSFFSRCLGLEAS